MKKDYFKSIIFSFICLIAIIVVNFFLPRLMPGDPVLSLIGADEDYITQDDYDYYYQELGLDKPMYVQFGNYIKDLFSGQLGYSYHHERPVIDVINERIPITLQITLPAIIISALIALFLGTKMGYKKNKFVDVCVTSSSIIINAVPTFLMAMIMVLVFAYILKWLPFGGLNSIIVSDNPFLKFLDRLKHLILPIATLVIVSTPSKYLMMRNTTATATEEKYVLYAKARGISPSKIRLRHIFKNICQPFIIMVGLNFGRMLSGSIIIEMIFSIDGMGMLVNEAIANRDFAILQGCFFIIAVMVIIANLLTDLVCILSDPRLKYGEKCEN